MHYELRLKTEMPEVNWQVKNQSNMHQKHGHFAYDSISDAMSFWPEKETAIAVRLSPNNRVEYLSVFGFDFLFDGYISHNVRVPLNVFEQRLKDKQWQKIWPNLKLKYNIDSLG